MYVYAVVFTLGLTTGSKELIGLYSTYEKATDAMKKHMEQHANAKHHYGIHEIGVDEEENIVFAEW